MNILNKSENSKGVVIFAFNTANIDYVGMALNAARLVKHTLGLPTTLITDKPVNNPVFENVIIVENTFSNTRIGYSGGTHWRNGNRYSAYSLSPYDETLLIDSDYLVLDKNLLKLFECTVDYKIMYKNKSLVGDTPNSMGTLSLDFVWATVVFFKKTEYSSMLFGLVKRIQDNYQYYRSLYHINTSNFRNDYAFAIANHILNGYTKEETHGIPWTMLTIDTKVNTIELQATRLVVRGSDKAALIPRQDIHIIDKDYLTSENYKKFVDTICQEN
jgi:hypothetical protein